jgi:hypothetical protein
MSAGTVMMWVIFIGPPRGRGAGPRYLARDGQVTTSRREAKTFETAWAARAFARAEGITLDGTIRYVGQESFTPAEIDWPPPG